MRLAHPWGVLVYSPSVGTAGWPASPSPAQAAPPPARRHGALFLLGMKLCTSLPPETGWGHPARQTWLTYEM